MKDGLSDPASGDSAQLLRSPDLRLVGLTWDCVTYDQPFLLDLTDTNRAWMYYILQGAAYFRTGSGDAELQYITKGMTVGVEGHAHHWMDASHVHQTLTRQLAPGQTRQDELPFKLIISTIDRSAAVLRRLPHGSITIPSASPPFSRMIGTCVDLVEMDRASLQPDPGVQRRLAEVIMLQLVGYSRSMLWAGAAPVAGALHDEFLLRAMTAFFANIGANWTVAGLAQAAGLSRAAFSERFSRAFGEPPLRTINRLRLQQSADMLIRSNASLSDIAQEIGFGSSAAFLRAFKKHFDMTPGKWRQQSRSTPATIGLMLPNVSEPSR